MEALLATVNNAINKTDKLPFAVYSSIKEQHLLNVSIIKPVLIVVLNGSKTLGNNNEISCHPGDFIFLSNSPAINIRNIPKNHAYKALLIEFDDQDIQGLHTNIYPKKNYYVGKIAASLEKCLQQFIESSLWAPEHLWTRRKRELIELLCYLGHQDILSMFTPATITYQLHDLFSRNNIGELTINDICHKLAMSESTLRRKLKLEQTTIQEVKDQTRLGLALHLLQTTKYSISLIAEKSGYLSQSRFTERFKLRFGLTPSQLRKTKMTD